MGRRSTEPADNGPAQFGLIYRKRVHETLDYRLSLIGGTRSGIDNEWYLGVGFTARLKIGVSLSPFRTGLCQVGIDWCPVEDVCLSIALEPFRRCCSWGWESLCSYP